MEEDLVPTVARAEVEAAAETRPAIVISRADWEAAQENLARMEAALFYPTHADKTLDAGRAAQVVRKVLNAARPDAEQPLSDLQRLGQEFDGLGPQLHDLSDVPSMGTVLKEEFFPAAPVEKKQGEPVAWRFRTVGDEYTYGNEKLATAVQASGGYCEPLYAAPFDVSEVVQALEGVIRVADRKTVEFDLARSVLAKLREATA
jgi:hypothetical protein